MQDYELVNGRIAVLTDQAALLKRENGEEVWIPRSLIEDQEYLEVEETEIFVAKWFCDKEGLA